MPEVGEGSSDPFDLYLGECEWGCGAQVLYLEHHMTRCVAMIDPAGSPEGNVVVELITGTYRLLRPLRALRGKHRLKEEEERARLQGTWLIHKCKKEAEFWGWVDESDQTDEVSEAMQREGATSDKRRGRKRPAPPVVEEGTSQLSMPDMRDVSPGPQE